MIRLNTSRRKKRKASNLTETTQAYLAWGVVAPGVVANSLGAERKRTR